MREEIQGFYKTLQWQNCRDAYMKSVGMMCERCMKNGLMVPAEIVHHKIHLTPKNIDNPDITTNFNNLQAVCRKCHGELHETHHRRYTVMPDGSVVIRE